MVEIFKQCFGGQPNVWVRAPGRVDLMGSHTDYNLGFVLTVPISRDTLIAARARNDGVVRVRSLALDAQDCFRIDSVTREPAGGWVNYVRGVAAVLRDEGYPLLGFDGIIDSNVPIGSGLSSSAALECSVAALFRELGGWSLDAVRMALLCQRAENEFAGVSCGILDQYTSCLGHAGCALLLDCRDLLSRTVQVAGDLRIVICDTRFRRELASCEYGKRRTQCEQGARAMGVSSLRESSLAQLYASSGVLSEETARRCRFIIEENARVLALAEALPDGRRNRIAALCAESFRGACELYEIAAQPMIAMMDAMLAGPGVVGARQAGAGFGGSMVAFVEAGSTGPFAAAVRLAYQEATGILPQVYPVEAASGACPLEQVPVEVGK